MNTQEVYAKVTSSILAALERGVAPWRRSWKSFEQQSVKGYRYRGINALITACVAEMKGHSDPRWLTFREAKKRGGHVRKGEKGVAIILWKPVKRRNPKDDEDSTYLLVTCYTVFNVEQCDGLELRPLGADHDPIEACEEIVAGYDGPVLKHGGDRACYAPLLDEVHMPPKAAFGSAAEYYGTLFHELVHSTGHASRLDRFAATADAHQFGSDSYSQEELVAEMGAAFLGSHAGIDAPLLEQHAAYCKGFLRRLKDDPGQLVKAAQHAQKAADLVLNVA